MHHRIEPYMYVKQTKQVNMYTNLIINLDTDTKHQQEVEDKTYIQNANNTNNNCVYSMLTVTCYKGI